MFFYCKLQYDSALWHWAGVSRGGKNEQSRNKGITIDFDIVPVGGGSYSNVSRRSPLLQVSSLPTSSSLSKGGSSQRTNVSPLGKMTKDFNTYLLLIRARLTFPLGEIPHHHSDQSNSEKILQRFFTLRVNASTISPNGSASGHQWVDGDKNLNNMTTGNNPINVSLLIFVVPLK